MRTRLSRYSVDTSARARRRVVSVEREHLDALGKLQQRVPQVGLAERVLVRHAEVAATSPRSLPGTALIDDGLDQVSHELVSSALDRPGLACQLVQLGRLYWLRLQVRDGALLQGIEEVLERGVPGLALLGDDVESELQQGVRRQPVQASREEWPDVWPEAARPIDRFLDVDQQPQSASRPRRHWRHVPQTAAASPPARAGRAQA